MFIVYFLKSLKNNKTYVGVTGKDPEKRLLEHNQGSNKFTKHNLPFALVYFEKYHCKTDAAAREKFYKTGVGRKIRDIIIEYTQSRILSSVG